MTQTEGEKEIVLGNKQLISLFFVVVALLGVFFAAGYMIGRKSVTPTSPASTDAGSAAASGASASSPLKQEPETARETPSQPDPGPGTFSEAQPEASSKPDTTTLSRVEATLSKPEAFPNRIAPEHRPETPHGSERTPARAETPDVATQDTAVTKPLSGATYLQVTALRRPDADNLVRSLREQNFPVTLAASSREGLYRVMVGPYRETAKVAESKSRLKALGFANAFVQK